MSPPTPHGTHGGFTHPLESDGGLHAPTTPPRAERGEQIAPFVRREIGTWKSFDPMNRREPAIVGRAFDFGRADGAMQRAAIIRRPEGSEAVLVDDVLTPDRVGIFVVEAGVQQLVAVAFDPAWLRRHSYDTLHGFSILRAMVKHSADSTLDRLERDLGRDPSAFPSGWQTGVDR